MSEVTRVYASDRNDLDTIERLVALDALPADWRSYFEKKLAQSGRPVDSSNSRGGALASDVGGAGQTT